MVKRSEVQGSVSVTIYASEVNIGMFYCARSRLSPPRSHARKSRGNWNY